MLDIYKDYLGTCLDASNSIELKKLPTNIRLILKNFLQPLCLGVPIDSLLIALNLKLAHVASFNRVGIEFKKGQVTPINYYSVVFMPSGSGKDMPLQILDTFLFTGFDELFKQRQIQYLTKRKNEIITEAESQDLSETQIKKYIQENEPRMLVKEFGDGTLEGFIKMREAYADAEFGSTSIQISEFADFITSENKSRQEFLTAVQEVYNSGDSKAKVIKGEKKSIAVKGVPNNILFHTSLAGLENDKGRARLLTFLNRGLARRSFIAYPFLESAPNTIRSKEELIELIDNEARIQDEIIKNASSFRKYIEKIISKTSNSEITLKLTVEARRKIEVYKKYNAARASYFESTPYKEGFIAELRTRDWKVLKLAGVIALIEHPEELEITVEDIEYAIYQAEVYGFQLRRFYDNEQITEGQELFNYLLQNEGEWKSRMDIRKQNFVSKHKFVDWFAEALVELQEILEFRGYKMEFRSVVSRQEYRIVKVV